MCYILAKDTNDHIPIGLLNSARPLCIYYIKTSPTSRETTGIWFTHTQYKERRQIYANE